MNRTELIGKCENTDQLFDHLRSNPVEVPLRGLGRTKKHTEPWIGCHTVAALATAGYLSFPLAAYDGERPDWLLLAGGARIGLEITEAIPTVFAHYSAYAVQEYLAAPMDPGLFRYGKEPPSKAEWRDQLSAGELRTQGWSGHEPESEWSLFIRDSILRKVPLGDEGFELFPQNWLTIYANLPLPPEIDVSIAAEFLVPHLEAAWASSPTFDRILVLHSQSLVVLERGSCELIAAPNLWPKQKR